MRLEGLGKLKKKIHLIGTRTRDLPVCSIVPQTVCNVFKCMTIAWRPKKDTTPWSLLRVWQYQEYSDNCVIREIRILYSTPGAG
jgi:hypothetical protein